MLDIEGVKRAAQEAMAYTGTDAELRHLGSSMALDHMLSEAMWEASGEARAAHCEYEQGGDVDNPLEELSLHFQARMYEHNRAKKKTAIKVVDGWEKDHPKETPVILAGRILRGHADRHRMANPEEDRQSEEWYESLARHIASRPEESF